MVYEINGKKLNIPDKDIDKLMKALSITKEEAIECWLEDNDEIPLDEESQALQDKASKEKIKHGAGDGKKSTKGEPKPKPVSDEKVQLFTDVWDKIVEVYGQNAQIIKENKEICVKINEKTFKIDLVQHRDKKK